MGLTEYYEAADITLVGVILSLVAFVGVLTLLVWIFGRKKSIKTGFPERILTTIIDKKNKQKQYFLTIKNETIIEVDKESYNKCNIGDNCLVYHDNNEYYFMAKVDSIVLGGNTWEY